MVTSASASSTGPVEEAPGEGATTSGDIGASMPDLWRTAPTYASPTGNWVPVGELYPGDNRYDCQVQGDTAEFAGRINDWWLKTDDDHGNTDVWVNALYVSGSENFEPIAGLPHC